MDIKDPIKALLPVQKNRAVLFAFLFLIGMVQLPVRAQVDFELNGYAEKDVPQWVEFMLMEKVDIRLLDSAYNAYYRIHPFQKNTYTQWYKRWRRKVEPFIDQDGKVHFPSTEKLKQAESSYNELRSSLQTLSKDDAQEWTCIGPFQTWTIGQGQIPVSWQANIYSLAVAPSDPDVIYAGGEAGGMFKSTNKGMSWSFASGNASMVSITSIAVDHTDPLHVLAGDGNAIYESFDGGLDWEILYLEAGLGVNDLAFHPSYKNVYLAACTNGLLHTSDNGVNWNVVWEDKVYDLEFKPGDDRTVYAVSGDKAENRCRFIRSEDSGSSFSYSESGWFFSSDPDRVDHGARLTVTPADPERIYAVLIGNSKPGDNGYIGVYRSDDAGMSWTLPQGQVGGPYSNDHPNLMTLNNTNTLYQGYYNLSIAASHTNADELLIGGLNLWRSRDGAKTYEAMGGYQGVSSWIHPDQQEILINGEDMWLANDGGINYSKDLFTTHEARNFGLTGSDFWGFDMGWNTDVMVGGRYHNGNTAMSEFFPSGESLRLGGGEAPTGYVNPGTEVAHFSDISSLQIPDQLDGMIRTLPKLGLYPNESYFASHYSEVVFHPRYFKTLMLGRDNALWVSMDGGGQFELLHSFGNSPDQPLMQIEVSRPDGQVIYVYQRTSFYGAALWKSEDAGDTWIKLTIPPANSQRAGSISMNPLDPQELVLCYGHQNNDGGKVFLTRDGGATWENLTTSNLDGQTVHSVLFQAGSDETIYLGTSHTVFYRQKGDVDWKPFWEGLPTRVRVNKLLPFYRDQKLRMATYGHGVWEREMVSPPPVQVQIMAAQAQIPCVNDTVYFDDYSIRPADVAWTWDFPGASYVSDINSRAPKVVYPASGVYSASMTLTTPQGTFREDWKDAITVNDACDLDLLPGNALVFQEEGDNAVIPSLDLTTNTFTITAWVHPFGIQNDYTAIVMNDGQAAGLNFNGGNNSLGYHWPGGAWWWNSGLRVPANEWSYVALVAYPDSMILYLNGVPAKHVAKLESVDIGTLRIGSYQGWNDRFFKGMVDELAIWDRSLTREEIRTLRHLVKKPSKDPQLKVYYQFNRENGPVLDKAGVRHADISGKGIRLPSDIPVGEGLADYIIQSREKIIRFPRASVTLEKEFADDDPGPWTITRLVNDPQLPPAKGNNKEGYWLLNYYGEDGVFKSPAKMVFDSFPDIRSGETVENWRWELWTREVHAEAGAPWFSQGNAFDLTAGEQGTVTFEFPPDMVTEAQCYVSRDTSGLSHNRSYSPQNVVSVFPNPVGKSGTIRIKSRIPVKKITLYDIRGKEYLKIPTVDEFQLPGLSSGTYILEVETEKTITKHRIIVLDNGL